MNPNDFSQHSGTAGGEHIGLLYMEIGCLEDGGTYTESSVPGSYMPIQRIEVCTTVSYTHLTLPTILLV